MKFATGFIVLVLTAVLLSGCTTTGTPQAVGTPTPTAGAQPTATGTTTPATPAGVTTEDGVTKITGSGDQTVQVQSKEGGYLLRYKYKNDMEITHKASSGMSVPLFSTAGSAMDPDGYYTMSRVEHWYSDDDETIEIKANGPYIIEMIQLPHGTPASVPQTYTGAGWRAVGPFTLNAGQAKIDFSAPELGATYAASVTLDDGTTGNLVSTISTGTNTVDIPETGVYYIEVNTNKAVEWTITVTQ